MRLPVSEKKDDGGGGGVLSRACARRVVQLWAESKSREELWASRKGRRKACPQHGSA